LLLRGQLRLASGEPREAIADLESTVTAFPSAVIPRMLLAEAYQRSGATMPAIKAYEAVLRIDAALPAAHQQLARLQMLAGQPAAAVEHAGRALSSNRSDPTSRLLFARALAANGEWARALSELRGLAAEDPRNADAHATLGAVLLAGRNWADAKRAFSAALAVDPMQAEATFGLINLAVQTRQFSEARQRLDGWTATFGHAGAQDVAAATAYAAIGAGREAEQLLLDTIQREPSRLSAYLVLGRLYVSQNRLDEARRQLEIVLDSAPGSVGAATMLGMVFEGQHKLNDAQATYRRALEIDPDAPVAANNLAWLYVNSGASLDVALQLAQTAARKLPETPEVNDTLGWIYYRKNMLPQAIQAFERAVAKQPGRAEFQSHLRLANLKAGRPQPGQS
jgi:tetratricopeptide (TPR) repeat protein